MSSIKDLIPLLTPSEVSGFIDYLNKRNKRKDTRNIEFFKSVLNGREAKLREQIGQNAFNVLKKRTTDNLISYLAGTTVESHASEEVDIIKDLMIVRRLFVHGKLKLAFKLLSRAEKKAIELSHFSLLNEIYHTYIENSHHELSPDQEMIFNKFEENQRRFLAQERMNMMFATIKKAFHDSEYGGEDVNVSELLEEKIDELGIEQEAINHFESLYKIAHIVDIYGAHSRSYHSINTFFEKWIKELQGSNRDTEKALLYHIDLLYTMANIYFRKKDFAKSQEYLSDMRSQMDRYDRLFYQERLPHYSTLQALCLHFTGRAEQAKEVLDEVIGTGNYKRDDLLNVYLTKAMICFQTGELKETAAILAKFHHTDAWYERNVGLDWILHKKYMEIILHIELENYDYVDSRIASLVRKYTPIFKKDRNEPVLPFLRLVRKYYHQPDIVTTDDFKAKVEKGINWKSVEEEDIFFICFFAWLKSKMKRTELYTTTMGLLEGS